MIITALNYTSPIIFIKKQSVYSMTNHLNMSWTFSEKKQNKNKIVPLFSHQWTTLYWYDSVPATEQLYIIHTYFLPTCQNIWCLLALPFCLKEIEFIANYATEIYSTLHKTYDLVQCESISRELLWQILRIWITCI